MREGKSEAVVSSVFVETYQSDRLFPTKVFFEPTLPPFGVAATGLESGIRSDTQRIPDLNPEAGSLFLFLFRLWRFHANQPELETICRHPSDIRPTTGGDSSREKIKTGEREEGQSYL
jgi:hypothetical protein